MKSELAKARDEWLNSEEGKRCCEGTPTGQWLQNRLELAFLAGADFSVQRIKKLETENKKMKEMKCPPISDGDVCICPIEELESMLIKRDERIKELEAIIKDVLNLINNKGHVSKWKIYNWLEQTLKG